MSSLPAMDWRTEYGLENNLHYRAEVVYRTHNLPGARYADWSLSALTVKLGEEHVG